MCTTCLRSGWRGIWENGRKLLKLIDACSMWEVSTDKQGQQTRHVPGKHLRPRLKRLWDFVRLQVHLHVEPASNIGAHCLQLKLGSLADERFNVRCDHGEQYQPPPSPEPACAETCCSDTCSKRPSHHCRTCATSFCKAHLRDNICGAEFVPSTFGAEFVCKQCSPRVEATTHREGGCATCDEVHYFKLDVMKVAAHTHMSTLTCPH